MNIFELIKPALVVLHEGKELENVEGWKNAQTLTNIGIAVITIASQFIPSLNNLSDEQTLNTVNLVAMAIAGILNAYFTIATSKRVGIPSTENKTPVESMPIISKEHIPEKKSVSKPINISVVDTTTTPTTGFNDK